MTADIPETRFARSGEVSIAYQVMGTGPIDMIFIPGIISNIELGHELPAYTECFRRLAKFCRVATFDKRGQGLSDRISGAPTLEERTDDVRAVMDAVGMKRAVVLAHSEGAAMGAYFAAAHPERVTHLVIHGGLPKFVRSDDYPYGPSAEDIRRSTDRYGSGSLVKLAAPSLVTDATAKAAAARFERQSCSPGNFRALFELNAKLDVRHILPDIRVPTLVLHTKTDRMAPVEGGRYFAEKIPGAKLIEYESGDHIFFLSDPSWFADVEEFVTGKRRDEAPVFDRILATVLFTDIVDSTARAAALGDAVWSKTLDEHDRIAKRLVEQHRGRLIKTTGDGVLATFDGPGRAIRCALGMEPALARLNLSVRAGLHTGEVEDRGDDIGGIAVHAASRVMATAGPGEVLVSRVVADLVAGSGITFADRGEAELKGMAGTWRLLAASI